MKKLLLLLAALPAFSATEMHTQPLQAPPKVYRGYSVWIRFPFNWFYTVPVTSFNVSPTNSITATGLSAQPFPSRALAFFQDAGATVPETLNLNLAYDNCNTASDTFKIHVNGDGAACGSVDAQFITGHIGSGTIYVGRGAQPGDPGSSGFSSVILDSTSLPSGMTMPAVGTTNSCFNNGNNQSACSQSGGKWQSFNGLSQFWMRVDVSAGASTGAQVATFTFKCQTALACADFTYTWNVDVEDVTPLTIAHPTSPPAIPSLATWEADVLTNAATYCPDKANGTINWAPNVSFQPGVEQQVWYYDGGWIYYQLANYTGDTQWNNCGNTIMQAYRDQYVLPNSGSILANRVFSSALKRSCATCQMSSRVAMDQQVANGAQRYGEISSYQIRVSSYGLVNAIRDQRVHGVNSLSQMAAGTAKNLIQRLADQHFNIMQTYVNGDWIVFQGFMAGIGMQAAIDWYDFSGDARFPVVVKDLCDAIWSDMWNKDGTDPNTLAYMRGAAGTGTSPGFGANCPFQCFPTSGRNLVNFVAPAFAWIYYMTGDTTYQTRADALWANAITYTPPFSGKEFSENYRWAFAFVNWRQGRPQPQP